jgi:hypothetical protein
MAAGTVAWLAGLAAVLAVLWMGRRWRRDGAAAAPGSRVARHQRLYRADSPWPLLLTGVLMIVNGAHIASRDPTGHDRVMGRAGIVLGVVGLAIGGGWLVAERRWNRRRPGGGTDQRPSP